MIDRRSARAAIEEALARSSVVLLIGPRQCGKTTLCRQFVAADSMNYFDLEDPVALSRLEQPITALSNLEGLIVIDEVQRRPELFPILRVLVDKARAPGRFLVLGSASVELLRQSSESLAGRVEILELTGFSLAEVGLDALSQHWIRGGFPLSYLSQSEQDSFIWRKNFIRTVIERDLPQLGIRIPATALLRFWTMSAHYHGQLWNAAEIARSLDVNESTARRYLDLLDGLFMVRQLKPWHANLKKRQVKSPKVYIRDSGLFHNLIGVKDMADLLVHPKLGASWEGYALEEVLKAIVVDDCYFWATHQGAELDLLLIKDGRKFGVEFKRVDAPRLTPSIRSALSDLELEKLTVLYPGNAIYSIAERVTAMPLAVLGTGHGGSLVEPLG